MIASGRYRILKGPSCEPEKKANKRFTHPEFPKKRTNPNTTRIEGMANGMAVTALRTLVNQLDPGPRSDPKPRLIKKAPGSPRARDTSTLKKACFIVKIVIRKMAAFSSNEFSPFEMNAFQKEAPYGRRKAKKTARTRGIHSRKCRYFFI